MAQDGCHMGWITQLEQCSISPERPLSRRTSAASSHPASSTIESEGQQSIGSSDGSPRSSPPSSVSSTSETGETSNDADPESFEEDAGGPGITPVEEIEDKLLQIWDCRSNTSRYNQVYVLMIQWEENDLEKAIEECVERYHHTFLGVYNYDVSIFKIPKEKTYRALAQRLIQLTESDGPENLFIIWYDGHGQENPDRRGPPLWRSHHSDSHERLSMVDTRILPSILGDCDADILLVNNSCSSLTCDRFNGKGVVESISASAFSTETYGSVSPYDELSLTMSWAVLKILQEQATVENGITIPELHRNICLGTQWAASNRVAESYWGSSNSYTSQNSGIRTQPVYTRLSADPARPGGRTRSIVLRRQDRIEDPFRCDSNEQIVVRLNVAQDERVDVREWVDWLAAAPSAVTRAKIKTEKEKKTYEW